MCKISATTLARLLAYGSLSSLGFFGIFFFIDDLMTCMFAISISFAVATVECGKTQGYLDITVQTSSDYATRSLIYLIFSISGFLFDYYVDFSLFITLSFVLLLIDSGLYAYVALKDDSSSDGMREGDYGGGVGGW